MLLYMRSNLYPDLMGTEDLLGTHDEDGSDPFGRTREELEWLDKADFDWKMEMEDRIGG